MQSPKIAVTDKLTFTVPGKIELCRVSFVLLLFLYIYKIFLFESVSFVGVLVVVFMMCLVTDCTPVC